MQSSDRRAAPRFRISIPLHFQLTKLPEPECSAETLDISSRGVCISTDAPPRIGAILMVRLRMPEMIMGWRAPEWRITGHVVHVERGSEPGKFEVGVQFHYYEAAAPRRARLLAEVEAPACA
jgi:PilZ domain